MALIRISRWSPHQEDELKLKIFPASFNGDIMNWWSFSNEEDAHDAFEVLSQKQSAKTLTCGNPGLAEYMTMKGRDLESWRFLSSAIPIL